MLSYFILAVLHKRGLVGKVSLGVLGERRGSGRSLEVRWLLCLLGVEYENHIQYMHTRYTSANKAWWTYTNGWSRRPHLRCGAVPSIPLFTDLEAPPQQARFPAKLGPTKTSPSSPSCDAPIVAQSKLAPPTTRACPRINYSTTTLT